MAIERNEYTDILFDGLIAAGCTVYGACGAIGNVFAESGANPRNLENLCEKMLGYKYTDDTYTEAVDSGEITRDLFLHPLGDSRQYGYGFCQWTSAGRKAGLYDLVKSRGVSIGDAKNSDRVHAERIAEELQERMECAEDSNFRSQEASDIFLVKFESPKNTGEAVKKARASYGEQYLKIYQKEETKVSKIENAVTMAEAIALDDTHGYDQVDRWATQTMIVPGWLSIAWKTPESQQNRRVQRTR